MNEYIYCIDEDEYQRNYRDKSELESISSIEDMSTLLDTFYRAGILAYKIIRVLDIDGKYVFVYSNSESSFDLIKYLQDKASADLPISIMNAKLQYPREKSRGYYFENKVVDDLSDTGELLSESDESPTGFLENTDELSSVSRPKEKPRFLRHISENVRLPVDDYGIIIGRSSSQSDYVIAKKIISKRHAKVYRRDGKYYVHDYKSLNGTYIDGLKVNESNDRELSIGSTLVLANEEFTLE